MKNLGYVMQMQWLSIRVFGRSEKFKVYSLKHPLNVSRGSNSLCKDGNNNIDTSIILHRKKTIDTSRTLLAPHVTDMGHKQTLTAEASYQMIAKDLFVCLFV